MNPIKEVVVLGKIYLSGPIRADSGPEIRKNIARFYEVGEKLRDLGAREVILPAIRYPNDLDPETLARDIRCLANCDSIFLMNGWEHSNGARCEYYFAKSFDYPVVYERTFEAWVK